MGSTAISEAIRPSDNGRQSWDEYFMQLAESISTRATCSRLKVGCLFVRDNRILTTGYNGALPGHKHCEEIGCLLHESHCVRSVHAEENAVAQAAQHGVSLANSYLYVNHLCCIKCYKLVLSAGASRVYYRQSYGTAPMDLYYQLQGFSRLEQIK
jgi:dCMP deaminase